jgi:hypothetical protein
MLDQPIFATKEELESGIASTVQIYVRLKDISALSKLKVQRLKLMTQHRDTEAFNFGLLRERCQKDIRAIDAGIRELAKDEPLRGNVDVFSFPKIAGWAQYIQYPEVPLTLEIQFDEKVVVRVVADRYRADLKAANLGSGHHGFEFVPWKLFLSSQVIEVKAPNGKPIGEYRKRQ